MRRWPWGEARPGSSGYEGHIGRHIFPDGNCKLNQLDALQSRALLIASVFCAIYETVYVAYLLAVNYNGLVDLEVSVILYKLVEFYAFAPFKGKWRWLKSSKKNY